MNANGRISTLVISLVAIAALSAKRFVSATGAVAAAGANAAGVAVDSAEIGEAVAVDVLGLVPVIADDVVAANVEVEVGASGGAIPKASGKTVGRSFTAATAAGQVILVNLIPN